MSRTSVTIKAENLLAKAFGHGIASSVELLRDYEHHVAFLFFKLFVALYP
ncbi:MAG: hypothetical protein ACOYK6_09025 [Chthoniobacterales bacterium]